MRIGAVSTVERAYQLAQSGRFQTMSEIKNQLRAEGYYDAAAQLEGRTLTKDLRRIIEAARQDA
jgi:hypothetical protein